MVDRELPAGRLAVSEVAALTVDDLAKRYRSVARRARRFPHFADIEALAGMSFDVRPGEIVGLLGPNGSGKTTTMKIAVGLVRADRGSCSVFGTCVDGNLGAAAPLVGALIETPKFSGRLSARRTLELLGRLQRVATSEVDRCLRVVGLDDVADREVDGFSLGMRQRLALAVAMLRRPRLLVLDEPANGLDPEGTHQLRAVLRHFVDEGGAVVLSSHVLAEVATLADRAVVVNRGHTLYEGRMDDLVRRGANRWRLQVINSSGPTGFDHDSVERDLTVALSDRFAVMPSGSGFEVTGRGSVDALSRLVTCAGFVITELCAAGSSLEDRYLDLLSGSRPDTPKAGWGQ